MRGLTADELRCLEYCLPGAPDVLLADVGLPLGTEHRLEARGLLRPVRGPDGEDDWCVTTPIGVQLLSLHMKSAASKGNT